MGWKSRFEELYNSKKRIFLNLSRSPEWKKKFWVPIFGDCSLSWYSTANEKWHFYWGIYKIQKMTKCDRRKWKIKYIAKIVMNVCLTGNCIIMKNLLNCSTYAGKRARKQISAIQVLQYLLKIQKPNQRINEQMNKIQLRIGWKNRLKCIPYVQNGRNASYPLVYYIRYSCIAIVIILALMSALFFHSILFKCTLWPQNPQAHNTKPANPPTK